MTSRALLLSFVVLFLPAVGWTHPCPEAEALLQAGNPVGAEAKARACLAAAPDDGGAWALLVRTMAPQGRIRDALEGVEDALSRHPEDLDLVVTHLRLLAWSGRLDEAWSGVTALPESALADDDTLRFTADLATWRRDDPEALKRDDRLLGRSPGDVDGRLGRARILERMSRGRGLSTTARTDELVRARADLAAACAARSDTCIELERFDARNWRYDLFVQGGWDAVLDRPDGQTGLLDVQARLRPGLAVGAEAFHRRRDFGAGAVNDTLLSGLVSYGASSGFLVDAAVGGTPAADFLPVFNAWIEPGWRLDAGVEARLRLWRMQYAASGATLLVPALTFITPPVSFTTRYFLSFDDAGERGDAVTVMARAEIGDDWSASVGAGGGDRADYLTVLNGDADHFTTIFGGVGWDVRPKDRLRLDASWRDEVAGTQEWKEIEVLVGWGRRF